MSLADNRAPRGGFINPFKAGGPGGMHYVVNPDGGLGSWMPNPRQQLAQIMSGGDTYYGRGGRGNAGFGGGYTTSGPRGGGFGYGGGMGWGRDSNGNRSSASQGIGMGGRGSFF